jgi:hypothetical protein
MESVILQSPVLLIIYLVIMILDVTKFHVGEHLSNIEIA